MKKYIFGLGLILTGYLNITSWGMSSPREDLAMVVVPERYSVIQVAFDLADRRPVVLVSYRGGDGNGEGIVLHAWNGKEWVAVSTSHYSEASFLHVLPRKAVLVGDETLLPGVLAEGASWAPQVWQVPSIKTDDLINSFGKIFKFKRSEWNWFAARYKLDLEDLNEDLRKDSWYYHPYIEDQSVPLPAADSLSKAAPVPEVPAAVEAPINIPEPVPQKMLGIQPIGDVQLPK